MCGIVGVLQYPSKVSRYDRIRALRFLFPSMLLSAESRGSDATGVYQLHADNDWMMIKKGQKASGWVPLDPNPDDPAVFMDLVETWDSHPAELKALVGHCRKATVGSYGSNNLDNHPFAIQVDIKNAILGVHNGTLTNHERIFSNLSEMGSPLKREGKVDSEAIFHLLYHISSRGAEKWTGENLRYAARRMDGSYAIIAVNSSFPDHVVVMRDDRPLEAAIIAPYNFVVLASEKKFIEDAVENYKVFGKFCDTSLLPIEVEHRAIPDREYRIFDLTRGIPEGKPEWKTFDLVADKGDLNATSRAVPEVGWTTYKSTTTTTTSSYGTGKSHTQQHTYQATTSKATPPAVTTPPPPSATSSSKVPEKTGEDSAVTEIEVADTEICSQAEAALAIIEARYLNLCPVFDNETDLALSVGATPMGMSTLPKVTIANMVAESVFAQGYALGLSDSHKSVEDIQLKARSLSKRMATIAEKKKGAQDRIWEMRQLLVAREVLERVGFRATESNIFLVLTKAMNIPPDRVEDILQIQGRLSKDAAVHKAESLTASALVKRPVAREIQEGEE